VSELTLGGLVKHVTQSERTWADFIVNGPPAEPDVDWSAIDWSNPPPEILAFQEGHRMAESETVAGLVTAFEQAAATTDELVRTVDLDADHPLPQAPWFTPGERWSNRRAVMHVIAEVSQHAGHADILREAIDGQKTMG
jgi:uncharacterized damage-inducible protein DinB